MLLYLTDYLMQFDPSFRVFQYLTLRAILGALTALIISFMVGPWMIQKLRRDKIGDVGRDYVPDGHFSKKGTPTMGGTLIIVAITVSTLLWTNLSNRYIWVILVVTLGYGIIGFIDDYRKVMQGNSDGISARAKLFWQTVIGMGASIFLYQSAQLEVLAGVPHAIEQTQYIIPFFKSVIIDIGWGYIIMTFLVIVGTSNAVNLTDGLDGLAIMPTVMVAAGLGIFAYLSGHSTFSHYLAIPHLAKSGELIVFCAALVGAGLGFLWFNTYPAMVFMGDVGALALGGALGVLAVLVRQEVVLVIMGGVFVAETLSVIIQVISFKTTGKRVFRMAPIHHHFELKGWPEPRVIVRFWIITFILVLVGLATLKLR